jgi:hypothetical protein
MTSRLLLFFFAQLAGAALGCFVGNLLGNIFRGIRSGEAIHRAQGTPGGEPRHKWVDYLTFRLLLLVVGAGLLYFRWPAPLECFVGMLLIAFVASYWWRRTRTSFDNLAGFKSWETDPGPVEEP